MRKNNTMDYFVSNINKTSQVLAYFNKAYLQPQNRGQTDKLALQLSIRLTLLHLWVWLSSATYSEMRNNVSKT